MKDMMNALQLNAPNELVYTQVPVPTPGANEVLCKVESISICGTDAHIIAGAFPGFWPPKFPLVLGHEWAGQVVALGEKTAKFGWTVGDRVAGIANNPCGHCKNCLAGRFTICLNYGKEGIHKMYGHTYQGAYAEYIAVDVNSISKIPDDFDYNLAACMDPLSIALHMVMRSGIQPGDTVFIGGSGAQGLMSIICCKSMGAGKIIISGTGHRLKAAEELGAITLDYKTDKITERVMEMTGGLGVKRVIECTGTAKGVRDACDLVARGGCISTVSLPGEEVALPIRKFVLDEIDFHGCRANPNTLEKAIAISNHYREELQRIITHEFAMSDYKNAFETFTKRLDNSLKVVVKPAL
ncbi:MAG: alcohol dehydrogenase catalytic domain-containing protein [Oscillospiraceae bacterium]|nr:alcohol dehydrogenase catalytic domain-containing protein [Oscillospiraceae bacterium]